MKYFNLYNQLKKKAVNFLSEGNFEEYLQTILLIDKVETRINNLVLLN